MSQRRVIARPMRSLMLDEHKLQTYDPCLCRVALGYIDVPS